MIIKRLSNLLLIFIFSFIFISFDSHAAEPSLTASYTWNFNASLSNFDSTSGNTSVSSWQEELPYYDWGNFDQEATNLTTYFYRYFASTTLFHTSNDFYAYKIVINNPTSFYSSFTNKKFVRTYVGSFDDFFKNTGHYGSNVSNTFSSGSFWFVNDFSELPVQIGFMGLFYQEDITIPESTVDNETIFKKSRPSYSISGSVTIDVYGYSYDDYQRAIIIELGNQSLLLENMNTLLEKIRDSLATPMPVTPDLDDKSVTDTIRQEQDLLDKDTSDAENDLNINLNSNANTFIWGIVDSFVTINDKVFTLLISILSLGIISLILNR